MAAQQKDVIYIDIDDEITSIIDKLKTSSSRIVALVLPKRATMLQSSVNMKLLKKAAADDKKQLVLITAEAGLLPLAGSIGIHVAKTLQSKPEIPEAPIDDAAAGVIDTLEETGPEAEDFDPQAVADKPVGDLAGIPETESKAKPELTPRPIPRASEPDEAIELDNTAVAAGAADAAATAKKPKSKKDKKLKVPNFNKFRLRLIIGAVVLIVLIVGWILANIILPKANIIVATDTSSTNSSVTLNLSTAATSLNTATLTVPTHLQQTQKTNSQQVPTTGQKNEGTPATGSVTMTAQVCNSNQAPSSVPKNAGLSANNLTFLTQSSTSFTFSGFKNNCANYKANSSTGIVAQSPGTQANNISNTAFTVSYQDPDNGATAYAAQGSTNNDGTDNNVQIVTQTDIDNATQKLGATDVSSIKTALQQALRQAGYYALSTTFSAGTPSTSNSANVGDQANTVTVTQTTTYTMMGAHKSDLQTLLDGNIDSQINTGKQSIQNDGFSSVSFNVLNQSPTNAQLTMQATATVGPKLNVSTLQKQVAGKKPGDVKSIISGDPGVTSVSVHLSPFWVSSVPSKTSKITITFQKSSNASNT